MATIKKIDFSTNDKDLQLLPFSGSLEIEVLECILSSPGDYYPIGLKYLKPKGMFYDTLNNEVWETMQSIAAVGALTAQKVLSAYESRRDNESLYHLKALLASYSNKAEFESSCLKLNEYFISRTIHRLGYHINQTAITTDALEVLGVATDAIDKIYRHISQMTEVTINDSIQALAKELHDISLAPDGMLGIKFTVNGLNKIIKGKRRGNFIVIAGSTGEGKTTLEMQEIRQSAENNIPVGCFSLEMKTEELLLIMSCDALNINTEEVLSGDLSMQNMSALGTYMERIKKMPLKILDKPAIKIGELKSVARMWKKNFGIREIWIDHLHLMEGDVHYSSPEQKYNDLANQLKSLAKELDIPIIALAQFARKEKGDNRMHKISDLKYAGGIEQAADVILLLYRPELYDIDTFPKGHKREGQSTKGYAKINVGKLRLLPKGDIDCHFTGTHFYDLNEWEYSQLNQPERPENPRAGFQQNYNPNKTIEQTKKEISDPF